MNDMKEFLIELSKLLNQYEVLIYFEDNKITIYKFYSDTMDSISITNDVLTERTLEPFMK